MAEHDAAWWEKQAGQYKAELDQLNPQLNVANARVCELEAKLSAVETLKSLALEQAAAVKDNFNACVADLQTAVRARDETAEALTTANAELKRLREAIAKKNAALAPCLAGVANQLSLIKTAIEAE